MPKDLLKDGGNLSRADRNSRSFQRLRNLPRVRGFSPVPGLLNFFEGVLSKFGGHHFGDRPVAVLKESVIHHTLSATFSPSCGKVPRAGTLPTSRFSRSRSRPTSSAGEDVLKQPACGLVRAGCDSSRLALNFRQSSNYVMTGVYFNNFVLFPAFVDSHGA